MKIGGFTQDLCSPRVKASNMPVPAVSPRNWALCEGLAQIKMGTYDVDAGGLGFPKQVEMLADIPAGELIEHIDEKESQSGPFQPQYQARRQRGGRTEVYHNDWGKNGTTVHVSTGGREKDHRPDVPEDVIGQLDDWVAEQYQNVPVEALSFNDKLTLLTDKVSEYFERLDCSVVVQG